MVNRHVYLDDTTGQMKASPALTINNVPFTAAGDIGDSSVRATVSAWKYWTSDPACNFQGTQYGQTTVVLGHIEVPQADTITNVIYDVFTGGSGLTSGQCFVGIYQNNALLGISATQHTAMQSAGVKTAALVGGPISVVKGLVKVAFLVNGTTAPSLARAIG